MILYCGSTESEFLSVVVLNVVSVQKFAGIFMKGLFRPWGKKNPHTDTCSTFKWRYFRCHLLWIQSSKQPDSTFSRAHSQLFRQDFKKSLVPFSFLPQALKCALDFQNHSIHTSSHLGTDFQKGLVPAYKPTCWLSLKTFPLLLMLGRTTPFVIRMQPWELGSRKKMLLTCTYNPHYHTEGAWPALLAAMVLQSLLHKQPLTSLIWDVNLPAFVSDVSLNTFLIWDDHFYVSMHSAS